MENIWRKIGGSLLLLSLLSVAATADIYIRNKPLDIAVEHQGVLYLDREQLGTFFNAGELERCKFDASRGVVEVDGTALRAPMLVEPKELVPVLLLAEALGYQEKSNPALGITDYTKAPTLEQARQASIQNSGGADYRVAEQRMLKIFQKTPPLKSHPELARVEKIGQQLAAVSDMPSLQWNFFILSDPDPNAFCCGAGWVAITDGLLALKLSDDELAGVLAHEIGHGCRKDLEENKFNREQLRRYGNEAERLEAERQQLLARKQQLLARAQDALDLADLASSTAQANAYLSQAKSLFQQAKDLDRPLKKVEKALQAAITGYKNKEVLLTDDVYQRKDEYDADITGIYYATRAGFSPTGLMDSLQKLTQARAKTFGQAAYQGGVSHPPVSARIQTMNKVLKDWRERR
jgi:hypothetical protein